MEAPSILEALGHDIRWQLVCELSGSDLRVTELVAATGEAQNLVSYHLRLLRAAGLIHERRSSADGRDIYYRLDRQTVAAQMTNALATLCPGPAAATGDQALGQPVRGQLASVLFLCTGNSARSQIAEAMLRRLGGRRVLVRSAGTHPVGVHPEVYKVLRSRNVHVSNLRSKSIAEFAGHTFDSVVSLCDIARTEPVELRGKPRLVHWSIPDPVAAQGGGAAVAAAFDRVAREIEMRVEDFYADLRTRKSAA